MTAILSILRLRPLKIRIARIKTSEMLGQTVVLDDISKLLFHWIKEGPYLKAGKLYGWKGLGIGINKSILNYAANLGYRICIIAGNKLDRYYKSKLDAHSLLKFSEGHEAIEYRRGVAVYIIPFTKGYFETVLDAKVVKEVMKLLEGDRNKKVNDKNR